MVLPSHIPPLEGTEELCVGAGAGRRPGGGAAEANRRFACPPRAAGGLRPVYLPLAGGGGGRNPPSFLLQPHPPLDIPE